MKTFWKLFCAALVVVSVQARAADLTAPVNTEKGQLYNKNYRDTGLGFTAATVDSLPNYSFSNFTSTTTVKTSAAVLHCITVNKTAAVAFTVYDSTAVLVTTPVIATFPASAVVGDYCYDVKAANGIQVNMFASGPDVTVSYR